MERETRGRRWNNMKAAREKRDRRENEGRGKNFGERQGVEGRQGNEKSERKRPNN